MHYVHIYFISCFRYQCSRFTVYTPTCEKNISKGEKLRNYLLKIKELNEIVSWKWAFNLSKRAMFG